MKFTEKDIMNLHKALTINEKMLERRCKTLEIRYLCFKDKNAYDQMQATEEEAYELKALKNKVGDILLQQ